MQNLFKDYLTSKNKFTLREKHMKHFPIVMSAIYPIMIYHESFMNICWFFRIIQRKIFDYLC